MANYRVPSEFLSKYSPKEILDLKRAFKEFDVNQDGKIDIDELSNVLKNLGEPCTDTKLRALITGIDSNRNEVIEFNEFLTLLHNLRHDQIAPGTVSSSSVSQLANVVQKHMKLHEVRGTSGGMHSFSEDEKVAFTEHINNCLNGDPQLPYLPLNPHSMQLFDYIQDGILLCKLINQAVNDTIDERALNYSKNGKLLNVYEKSENQTLCINAAKSIGCTVVNIGTQDLIEGKPILVLGLVWQIVKIQLTSTINLKHHPELVRLLEHEESLTEFMKLPPDQILLRWVNYHLDKAQHDKKVSNFGKDMQDATAYSVLLHQIAPTICQLCREPNAESRASRVIENARKLQVETFLKPSDITNGNPKLNMSFVAQLFNICPALNVLEEDKTVVQEALDDDVGDTREERIFRMWINSMGIDGIYVNHLFSDMRDGIVLLKVMDKVEPGVVQWRQVNLLPKNKFKKVENCNYCVVLGKQMKFSLVNIGGIDISDGNKKLILAVIWQLMRYQQLKIISSLSKGGTEVTDNDIIRWANEKVKSVGKNRNMYTFRDNTLSDSLFLLDLVSAIKPTAINWDLVTAGKNGDEKTQNAKYVITVARKIGATVFLTFEDIIEVKPKMIMTFVATLMSVDMNDK